MPAIARRVVVLIALLCLSLPFSSAVCAAEDRVLPEGKLPSDSRLGALKDLNGYFPFEVPDRPEVWGTRARALKKRILVATGLWPLPDRWPLNPVIHGRTKRIGFTVEKVYFESVPNHFVTGLLFRPAGSVEKKRRLPAVLCPHGHGGRLQDHGPEKIRQLIERGEERFEASGRFPKLARCAQLARMGCVTFIFDMMGYADSVQISYKVAHRLRERRPSLDTKERWGFFSTQAELRLISIMGLQTWNSIRALDFLTSLPDVDPLRIGVTGGSGGGTQTILLGAIDPRPIVSFPQGMVSTSMQGGCTCENCSLLRIGTGNVELAALFAPRPQGMTAANDWTKAMMTKGYPSLQRLYNLLDEPDKVMCKPLLHFPHNYNYVTRALMYEWFNKHLRLGAPEPIVERDFVPLTTDELAVWKGAPRAKPETSEDYESSLCQLLATDAAERFRRMAPRDARTWVRYREVIRDAYGVIIGRELPAKGTVQRVKVNKEDRGGYILSRDLVRTSHGEELPVVSWYPKATPWNKRVVIWVHGAGKNALAGDRLEPGAGVQSLLAKGVAVLSADLLHQGEFLADGKPLQQTRKVGNPRAYAGFTFGYNHTLFAQRVHDILTLTSFVMHDEHGPEKVYLVGTAGAGPWVAAARAIAGGAVHRVAVDTGGFRFVDLESYRDVNFLPGAVKYGDLPVLLALSAPEELWIGGEGGRVPHMVEVAYKAVGHPGRVHSFAGDTKAAEQDLIKWLLRP